MKRSEIAKLVTVVWAAEAVGRPPKDEDVRLWEAFATEGAWESYDAALRAYVVHRTENPNFPLRPGHITQVLERVRKAARDEFNRRDDPRPPQSVADDPHPLAYSRWLRDQAIVHRNGAVEAFGRGGVPAPRAIEAAT